MDRTTALNHIDIGGGRRGHRNRNTAAGQPGTQIDAVFMNALQEELLALVEGIGLTPNAADTQQVWQAVRRMSGAVIRSLTATAALNGDDGVVFITAAAGNVVLTLPPANAHSGAVAGAARISSQRLLIVRTDTSANTVTLQRAGSDALGAGTATSYLLGVGERLAIQSDAGAWWLLNSNMTGQRTQVFSADGTFTAPAWVTQVHAEAIGGGGGGGGNTTQGGGGGGGGGGYAAGTVNVTGGQAIAVTRGAGGAGGVNNGGSAAANSGGNGGSSSFGSAVVAGGGTGGQGSISGGQGNSGPGGAGTTGARLASGGAGDAGFLVSTTGRGGRGGDAARGGGGGGASSGLPSAGGGPGGGGAGGGNNFAGAAGANGEVAVWF